MTYSLDKLKDEVADGSVDTVIVAFPDMQGRLIGKRFHAPYFLESAHEETHGCDYLLANDIDMEPVPERRCGRLSGATSGARPRARPS